MRTFSTNVKQRSGSMPAETQMQPVVHQKTRSQSEQTYIYYLKVSLDQLNYSEEVYHGKNKKNPKDILWAFLQSVMYKETFCDTREKCHRTATSSDYILEIEITDDLNKLIENGKLSMAKVYQEGMSLNMECTIGTFQKDDQSEKSFNQVCRELADDEVERLTKILTAF